MAQKRQTARAISIIGDGGWGTAIALHLHKQGHSVQIWSVFPKYAQALRASRENKKYLPGFTLPKRITITTDLSQALASDIIIFAVPTQYLRGVLATIDPKTMRGKIVLNVAKGIENKTLMTPHDIIRSFFPRVSLAVLSGPSHAEEVARGIPTCVVIAGNNKKVCTVLQTVFMSPLFRVYTSSDIVGVELGGAVKNVIAIAAGMCDGLGYGANTKAALISRGLNEATRLGSVLGARPQTIHGLSGLGDLITTSFSPFGRNRAVGEKLARGKTITQIRKGMAMVAEGVQTAQSVVNLAKKKKVEVPICHEVYKVLYAKKSPKKALTTLMMRAPRAEGV